MGSWGWARVVIDVNWPAPVREAVEKDDILGAIDYYVANNARPPDVLLVAAGAKLTEQSTTGHQYKVEWYLGRCRIHAVKPGKTETIPTPPRKQ